MSAFCLPVSAHRQHLLGFGQLRRDGPRLSPAPTSKPAPVRCSMCPHHCPTPFSRPTRRLQSHVTAASFKPVETLKKELDIQSSKLDDNVRQRVEQAVKGLGCRVTVGDVAGRAGVKLSEAEAALKALVYDSLGNLEVSQEGELLYVFASDFQTTIRNKSLLLRAKPVLAAIRSGAMYLVRVGFGAALITSVLLVTFAILVLLSSNRDDRDRDRGSGVNLRLWLDLSDLFYFFDPYYYSARRRRMASGKEMSFVESIYSFVFGDGDPNADFDERRWKLLGRYIQSTGGVVVAEEIAPFLDPASGPSQDRDSTYVDENVVLPALIKFEGEPFVDEDGNILYRFPSLQKTAQGRSVPPPAEKAVLEENWQFSSGTSGQQLGTMLLGGLNVFGVGVLGSLLADGANKAVLAAKGLGFITGLMPALQLYAAGFFAIPAVRWFLNQNRNAEIDKRNNARLEYKQQLERPGRKLQRKLENARRMAAKILLGRTGSIYTTEQDMDSQVPAQDLADFDSRLGGKGGAGARARVGTRKGQLPDEQEGRLWDEWVGQTEKGLGRKDGRGRARGKQDNTGGW